MVVMLAKLSATGNEIQSTERMAKRQTNNPVTGTAIY